MDNAHHLPHTASDAHSHHGRSVSLERVAFMATLHCLAGCAIGEVAGMVLGTALGWGNLETIALAIALAFVSGYALTMVPLLRAGYGFGAATRLALAADTASITVMEIVDNLLMWMIPGAMDASLDSAPWMRPSTRGCSGAAWVWRWPSPVWRPTRSTGG